MESSPFEEEVPLLPGFLVLPSNSTKVCQFAWSHIKYKGEQKGNVPLFLAELQKNLTAVNEQGCSPRFQW